MSNFKHFRSKSLQNLTSHCSWNLLSWKWARSIIFQGKQTTAEKNNTMGLILSDTKKHNFPPNFEANKQSLNVNENTLLLRRLPTLAELNFSFIASTHKHTRVQHEHTEREREREREVILLAPHADNFYCCNSSRTLYHNLPLRCLFYQFLILALFSLYFPFCLFFFCCKPEIESTFYFLWAYSFSSI